ncbi:MAG TPA: formylglycine-generating enzyme family protein [Sedimentisphaerales bacterium]|nr:formylglycine-generating enzyme family protein [Sedimentisphaerales bacterium]
MKPRKQKLWKLILLLVVLVTMEFCLAGPNSPDADPSTGSAQTAPINVPQEKVVQLDEKTSMTFVYIPAGKFIMGSPPSEYRREFDEDPVHEVVITKGFYMGKYEVTQQQYLAIMKFHPGFVFPGNNRPAENIEWHSTKVFMRKWELKSGIKFRLPTEAEWEYACRAGTETAFYTGKTISPDQANYNCRWTYLDSPKGLAIDQTKPVGSYKPNAFGLYDMHGNVAEWCQDWYQVDAYKRSTKEDPQGPREGLSHVLRGGSWRDGPQTLRSAERASRIPRADRGFLGFRVVMPVQ